MKRTVLITGRIGSGKSEVCRHLSSKGYPVYDSDSRCKALYDNVPGLKLRIEEALGVPFSELGVIFRDREAREKLESIVYPLLIDDFNEWRRGLESHLCFLESALALDKPIFDGLYDEVWEVRAPLEVRAVRNPKAAERDAAQSDSDGRADIVIENDSTIEQLHKKIDIIMKTDLARILAVSGQHGLYQYLAQSRNGAIAERLEDKRRTVFDTKSRITTLEDIAIFTSEGELKLAEVFTALSKVLDGKEAPSSKASSDELKALFTKAVPNYDGDRFYVSHMKKVVDWYNELLKYATLDFMTDEDRKAAADE